MSIFLTVGYTEKERHLVKEGILVSLIVYIRLSWAGLGRGKRDWAGQDWFEIGLDWAVMVYEWTEIGLGCDG